MKRNYWATICGWALILILFSVVGQAQQSAAASSNVMVPPLVKFSGTLDDVNGKPLSGIVGVTFALYKEEQGGSTNEVLQLDCWDAIAWRL